MELQAFISFIFFTFTIVFFLFSLSIFIIRLKCYCNCDTCISFVTRTWTSEFVNISDWYTHLLSKSSTGTIHVHVLNNIITANLDNVEYMLKTNFDNYPKGRAFSALLGDLLGRGIFNADSRCWLFQRKLASLGLGSLSIRSHALNVVVEEMESRLIPFFNAVADNIVDSVDNNVNSVISDAVLDLQDVFRRFSFDVICKFSFGLDPGSLELSLPVSELESAFDSSSMLCAERGMASWPLIWKLKRVFNIGSERKLNSSIRVVKRIAEQVIKNRRKNGSGLGNDLLSRFMGSISDDDYLIDIVISFLLAGRDTVASGLTTFFMLLSQNHEVLKKIREELGQVIGNDPAHETCATGFRSRSRSGRTKTVALLASRIARKHVALPTSAIRL